jgi:hypothetical protein
MKRLILLPILAAMFAFGWSSSAFAGYSHGMTICHCPNGHDGTMCMNKTINSSGVYNGHFPTDPYDHEGECTAEELAGEDSSSSSSEDGNSEDGNSDDANSDDSEPVTRVDICHCTSGTVTEDSSSSSSEDSSSSSSEDSSSSSSEDSSSSSSEDSSSSEH